MTEARCEAVNLAQFYFRRIAESAGWQWDGDNDAEVEMLVSFIIDAARDGLRGQLDDMAAQLRVLDRLRPTCVICLDATADRLTSRGPACTDCVGDPPGDGADPDRPETWAFGEPPVMTARPDDGLPECGRIEAHGPHEYRMFLGARAHCGGMS